MPFSENPHLLIIYSSPESCDRLRLDKEHRALDVVIRRHSLERETIRCIHAASLLDVARALQEHPYEIVQFSCHGDANGVFLESDEHGATAPWTLLANTLRQQDHNLSVVILTACYSASAESALLPVVPILIAVEGAADDEASIAFTETFFDVFFHTRSVESAFRHAMTVLEIRGLTDKISPILLRRQYQGSSMVQAFFGRTQPDSIFIDLTQVEDQISALGISRQHFISLLTRKIQIHRWIFSYPRENAVLPIGHFFGVFSWQNANDVVVCHKVMQLAPGISDQDCLGWIRLLVIYNDLCSERYRTLNQPAAEKNKAALEEAIRHVSSCYNYCLCRDDVAIPAKELAREQYAITCSTVKVHLDRAIERFKSAHYIEVVMSLESAISSIHDLLDELTKIVTVQKEGSKLDVTAET